MTDDDAIIGNAAATALNQEDLATLIQMDYKTIYLCGENFNVPIRKAGVRYVGVLSTPKIKIRAQSQDELDAAGIVFENVQLPWQKSLPIDELKVRARKFRRSTNSARQKRRRHCVWFAKENIPNSRLPSCN